MAVLAVLVAHNAVGCRSAEEQVVGIGSSIDSETLSIFIAIVACQQFSPIYIGDVGVRYGRSIKTPSGISFFFSPMAADVSVDSPKMLVVKVVP